MQKVRRKQLTGQQLKQLITQVNGENMGDGAVKTGSKKSADEMDKKKKKSVPNEKGCVFFVANTADESSPP